MRCFRSTPAVYADICAQLDAAYGYPNEATKTLRSLPLPSDLPSDQQGRLCLCVSAAYCDYNLPSQMLPQLLASGAVEEITQAEYQAVLPIPLPTPIWEGDTFPVSPSNPRFQRQETPPA